MLNDTTPTAVFDKCTEEYAPSNLNVVAPHVERLPVLLILQLIEIQQTHHTAGVGANNLCKRV